MGVVADWVKGYIPRYQRPTNGNTSPVPSPPSRPDLTEVSANESFVFSKWQSSPYNPDDDLSRRKGLFTYQKMRQDDQIKACLKLKKGAVISSGWEVRAASSDPVDLEVRDYVEYALTNLEPLYGSFDDSMEEILSALDYGFSVTEILYKIFESGPFEGKIGLRTLKTRRPHTFYFFTDGHGNLLPDGIHQGTNKYQIDKFLIFTHQKQFGNWYGVSDLRAAYRAWWAKDNIVKWWLIFLERYGIPIAMGKYPITHNRPSDIQALRLALENIQANTSFTFPDVFSVDLKEVSGQGSIIFERALNAIDTTIARSLLVPSLLGVSPQPGLGTYAQARKHFDMLMLVVEDLQRDLREDVIQNQLVTRLVDYNYSVTKYPQFDFKPFTEKDSTDLMNMWMEAAKLRIIQPTGEDAAHIRTFTGFPPGSEPQGVLDITPTPPPTSPSVPPVSPSGAPPVEGETSPVQPTPSSREGVTEKLLQSVKDLVERPVPSPVVNIPAPIVNVPTPIITVTPPDIHIEAPIVTVTPPDIHIHGGERPGKWGHGGRPGEVGGSEEGGGVLSEGSEYKKESYVLNRTPFSYEKKASFSRIGRGLDEIQTQTLDRLATILQQSQDTILESVAKAQKQGYLTVGFVKAVRLKYRSDLSRTLREFVGEAYRLGGKEVKSMLPNVFQVREILGGGIPPEKALKFFENKAIWITGVVSDRIEAEVQNILLNAIKTGEPAADTIQKLREVFLPYLGDPTQLDPDKEEQIMPYRLETILRTNATEAFSEGLKDSVDDQISDGYVIGFLYSAIIDERTTPVCEFLDGKIFRADSPEWDQFTPPNHFNCRSVPIPVTRDEAPVVFIADKEIGQALQLRPQGFVLTRKGKQYIVEEDPSVRIST